MNIANLFHWSYWFSSSPPAEGWVKIVFITVSIVLILAGIVLKGLSHSTKDLLTKKVYNHYGSAFLFFGLFTGLWTVLRQEETPIFSARFWLVLIVVSSVWWISRIFRYATKRVPEIRKQNAERVEKEKYLPKKS